MLNSTTRALEHPPTAPLPPAAVAALQRLDAAGLPVSPTTLAAQLLKSRVRAAELADLGGAGYALSPLEWDDLAHAEDLIAGVPGALKNAGRLDLIGGAS